MSTLRLAALAASTLVLATGAFALSAARQGMQMPMPGKEHREILRSVGEWEGTLTHYMMNPSGDSVPATETVEAIGGFWTQATFRCEFMGAPYHGTGCVGYDQEKKKFVGTWIDNMSSYLAVMEGEKDEQTGAIVMRWMAPDGMTGLMVPHRNEVKATEDRSVSTFYVGEGEGRKIMEIDLKRKGAKEKPAKKQDG